MSRRVKEGVLRGLRRQAQYNFMFPSMPASNKTTKYMICLVSYCWVSSVSRTTFEALMLSSTVVETYCASCQSIFHQLFSTFLGWTRLLNILELDQLSHQRDYTYVLYTHPIAFFHSQSCIMIAKTKQYNNLNEQQYIFQHRNGVDNNINTL